MPIVIYKYVCDSAGKYIYSVVMCISIGRSDTQRCNDIRGDNVSATLCSVHLSFHSHGLSYRKFTNG